MENNMERNHPLINSNYNSDSTNKEILLNINYDDILKQVNLLSDKIIMEDTKHYYFKNNGNVLFAVENVENKTLNIYYSTDYKSLINSNKKMAVLTISKDFTIFNRDSSNGNLLCGKADVLFLEGINGTTNYKKIISQSIIKNGHDSFINKFFRNHPESIDYLNNVSHNSTDGYLCELGELLIKIPIESNRDKVAVNILSFNGNAIDLGNIICPVYNFYHKLREFYNKKNESFSLKKRYSTENMKDRNFDEIDFSSNVAQKYENFYNDIINKRK